MGSTTLDKVVKRHIELQKQFKTWGQIGEWFFYRAPYGAVFLRVDGREFFRSLTNRQINDLFYGGRPFAEMKRLLGLPE